MLINSGHTLCESIMYIKIIILKKKQSHEQVQCTERHLQQPAGKSV